MNIAAPLAELVVPTDDLQFFPSNPRKGNVELIKQSLETNGQYRPIVVNRATKEVLAGNHTLAAARELGWQEIAATFVEVDQEQATRIALIDNRANDVAAYDEQALVDLLSELPDLDATGFEQADLDELLSTLAPAPGEGGDTEPGELPAEPRTRIGDLYVLGEHRLLCGDSSDTADLDRVFQGVEVGCVLTDPPYGISLETDYRLLGTGSADALLKGTIPTKYRPVVGDDKPFDAALLSSYFTGVDEQFWFGADYYRRTLSTDDCDGSWLVWDKRNEATDAGFGSAFELLWSHKSHKRDILRHFFFGAFGSDAARRFHPTQKPTKLLAEILNRWAPDGCIVADPFLGSGATLIACEKMARDCYGLEIDPAYCDVIVDRWQRHTGQTAQLL